MNLEDQARGVGVFESLEAAPRSSGSFAVLGSWESAKWQVAACTPRGVQKAPTM